MMNPTLSVSSVAEGAFVNCILYLYHPTPSHDLIMTCIIVLVMYIVLVSVLSVQISVLSPN